MTRIGVENGVRTLIASVYECAIADVRSIRRAGGVVIRGRVHFKCRADSHRLRDAQNGVDLLRREFPEYAEKWTQIDPDAALSRLGLL